MVDEASSSSAFVLRDDASPFILTADCAVRESSLLATSETDQSSLTLYESSRVQVEYLPRDSLQMIASYRSQKNRSAISIYTEATHHKHAIDLIIVLSEPKRAI